jgi:hypothetical protein
LSDARTTPWVRTHPAEPALSGRKAQFSAACDLLLGVVGTADERSRFDVEEAERQPFFFQRGEFV